MGTHLLRAPFYNNQERKVMDNSQDNQPTTNGQPMASSATNPNTISHSGNNNPQSSTAIPQPPQTTGLNNHSSTNQASQTPNGFSGTQTTANPLPTQATSTTQSISAATPVINQPKKSSKTALVIGAIIGLVVLIGGGAFAYKALVIDNQPQNIVDQAISRSLTVTKPVKTTYEFTPVGKTDSSLPIQDIKGYMLFDPKAELMHYNFAFNSPMIGDNQINLLIDTPNEKKYIKLNLNKKILMLLQLFLPTSSTNDSPFEKLYQAVNDQWIMIDEDIAKEIFESSNQDSQQSLDKLTNLTTQCRNRQALNKLKFVKVEKELDSQDNYRHFEVSFSQDRLEESLSSSSGDQCAKALKEVVEHSQSKSASNKQSPKEPDSQKFVLVVDKKTKLVHALTVNDKTVKIKIDFDYSTSDKIEIPQKTKTLTEIQKLIEDLQQELSDTGNFGSSNGRRYVPHNAQRKSYNIHS